MRVLLAGVWARRGLNIASLVLAVLAIAVAMLGPMYSHAAAEHLLDTRLDQRATFSTGLSSQVAAMSEADLPEGSPSAYDPPDPDTLVSQAVKPLETAAIDRYWEPTQPWLLDGGPTTRIHDSPVVMPLYWHAHMCTLAEVSGRCPARAGEALIDPAVAKSLGVRSGDTVRLSFPEQWIGKGDQWDKERLVDRSFTVVGTYRVPEPVSPRWGDPYRMAGGDWQLAGMEGGRATGPPKAPALLVDPASMTSQTFVAGADRQIDPGRVDLDTMDDARKVGDTTVNRLAQSQEETSVLDLGTIVSEVHDEQTVLDRITLAAVVPLVVLALLLLHTLVAAGAELRRPQVALAKLRGLNGRQVRAFALLEPVALVVVSLPVGALLAYLAARVVTAAWLGAGVPLAVNTGAVLAGVAVAAVALAASAAATSAVLREPLVSGLGAPVRATRTSRWGLIGRSVVVAAAVAAAFQLVTSHGRSIGVLGLVSPVLVASAVAVAATAVLPWLARGWVRRTGRRPGTSAYLASRRLARRRDLGAMMTPLLLAVTVTTFATSAWAVADAWKVSRADADVGAPQAYRAAAAPSRLLEVTHEVDPDGSHLAAVVVRTEGDGTSRQVMVDTSRLAAVAAWDSSWSSQTVKELQDRLTWQPGADPIVFTGTSLAVGLRDVRLDRKSAGDAELHVRYVDDRGDLRDVRLGTIADTTLRADLDRCRRECRLQQVYVSGSNTSPSSANGRLTLTDVRVDGRPADWHLHDGGAWQVAHPFPVSPSDAPAKLSAGADGLRIRLYLGALPQRTDATPTMIAGTARISPTDVPDVLPALVADQTSTAAMPPPTSGTGIDYPEDVIAGSSMTQTPTPIRVVGSTTALPGIGSEGILYDLAAAVRQPAPAGAVLDTRLWVADGTPRAMLDEVEAAGISLSGEQTVDAQVTELRNDAFSLGWRVFLLVGVLTLLLAVVGVFASTLAQQRWRTEETAALRLVRVRSRALNLAALLEHTAMLGLAVLAGIVASVLTLTLVLPTIDPGRGGAHAPPPDYAIQWPLIAGVAVVVFVLAVAVTTVSSARTTRRGSPSSLPWNEQP